MANFSRFDVKMFELAKVEAQKSDFAQFHLGCVLVYKRHIIGRGYNSEKTHPIQKRYNKKYRTFNKSSKPILDKIHAEIAALNSVPYPVAQNIKWDEVKVYIFRTCPGKPRGIGNARPCPGCMQALRDKGIKEVYYTTDDGFAYERLM